MDDFLGFFFGGGPKPRCHSLCVAPTWGTTGPTKSITFCIHRLFGKVHEFEPSQLCSYMFDVDLKPSCVLIYLFEANS